MKKIDILGWYNRKNIGDDAFNEVFKLWLHARADFQFVTPPDNVRPDADLVVLGGGAVASPYYFKSMATAPNAKSMAVGIDIEWEKEAQLLHETGFDHIVFRSEEDTELYNRLFLPATAGNCAPLAQAEYCPDLAFYLQDNWKHINVLERYRKKNDRPVLAVFLTDYVMPSRNRDLYYFGPRADQFACGLGAVLDDYSEKYEILMVPCSIGESGDDRRVNAHVASFMHHKPTQITDYLCVAEMIALIRDCRATLCMRYHAHIFSLIAGTPFASIEFTKKARTLLSEFNNHLAWNRLAISRFGEEATADLRGFFNFDEAHAVITATLHEGKREEDREPFLAYADSCRKRVESLKERLLNAWL